MAIVSYEHPTGLESIGFAEDQEAAEFAQCAAWATHLPIHVWFDDGSAAIIALMPESGE